MYYATVLNSKVFIDSSSLVKILKEIPGFDHVLTDQFAIKS